MRGSMARVHLLVDELPSYIGFDGPAEGPQHRRHQLLGATVENFEIGWEAMRRRELPSEFVIEAVIQSTTDPSLSTPGRHTLTLGVQQLPYDIAGGWDARKEEFTERVLADLEAYAPGIRGHVLEQLTITPLDIEREYGLTEGDIFHGAMFLDQLFGSRPIPRAVGLPHAGRRLLPLRLGHPPGRRRHGRVGPATRRTSRWRAPRRWRRCARPASRAATAARSCTASWTPTPAAASAMRSRAARPFRPVARLAARRRGPGA